MITYPQKIETHAVRANKLDLLERLADDLAHEIKNPLHSMVINLEVLKRRVARATAATDDPNDMMRYIGVLNGELERVSQRVELLLRLVRPGRGAETVNLHELIEEMLELLQLEGSHRDVSVQYEPSADVCRARVPRDPARQLLLNVVLDVLDALTAGGTLVVRTTLQGDIVEVKVRGQTTNGGADFGSATRWAVAQSLTREMGGSSERTAQSGSLRVALHLPLSHSAA